MFAVELLRYAASYTKNNKHSQEITQKDKFMKLEIWNVLQSDIYIRTQYKNTLQKHILTICTKSDKLT